MDISTMNIMGMLIILSTFVAMVVIFILSLLMGLKVIIDIVISIIKEIKKSE